MFTGAFQTLTDPFNQSSLPTAVRLVSLAGPNLYITFSYFIIFFIFLQVHTLQIFLSFFWQIHIQQKVKYVQTSRAELQAFYP